MLLAGIVGYQKVIPNDRHDTFPEFFRHGPLRTLPVANPATAGQSLDDADESPIKILRNPAGCDTMTLTDTIREIPFYLQAAGNGLALILMIGILAVRSLVTSEPIFSF